MLAFIKSKGNLSTRMFICFLSEREERGLISRKKAGNRANFAPRAFVLPFSKGKAGGRHGTGRDEVVIDNISTFLIGSISRLILHNQLPLTKHFTYYF